MEELQYQLGVQGSQLNTNGADVNVLYGHDYSNLDPSQYLSPLPNSGVVTTPQ